MNMASTREKQKTMIKEEVMKEEVSLIPQNAQDLFTGPSSGESFDNDPVVFLADSSRYNKDIDGLEKYVEAEIKRIGSERKSLIKAILTNRLNVASVPSRLLFNKIAELGLSHVYLKLTDECDKNKTAPDKDPHGALIAEKYRGRVLIAKLGNKGGDIQNSENADPSLTDKFSGKKRQALFNQRAAYYTAQVSAVPTKHTIEKALLIMAQWGFGVKEKRFISRAVSKTDKTPVYQDCWIVEECNFDETYKDIVSDSPTNLYI